MCCRFSLQIYDGSWVEPEVSGKSEFRVEQVSHRPLSYWFEDIRRMSWLEKEQNAKIQLHSPCLVEWRPKKVLVSWVHWSVYPTTYFKDFKVPPYHQLLTVVYRSLKRDRPSLTSTSIVVPFLALFGPDPSQSLPHTRWVFRFFRVGKVVWLPEINLLKLKPSPETELSKKIISEVVIENFITYWSGRLL